MKLISYTVFGKENWYRRGWIHNIKIAKNLFSDWIVRVYLSDKIEKEFIEKVSKYKNVDLILKKKDIRLKDYCGECCQCKGS